MCITSKKTKLKFRTRHAKMAASENSRRLLGARAGDARRSLAARRNRMWAPEVCLWLAAMLAGCCALQEQKFAMEPQDQTTKTRMLSIKDCETPDFPVDAHPLPHTFSIHAVRGVNYVRTNFTIERATPPISISLRGYRVVNKARRLDFRMDRVNCRHPVLGAVLDSFHVRYHRHNCTGIPGDYGSDRFNLDDIAKTFNFYNVFSLGTYIIEMEYITSKNTCIMCYALTLVLWK